MGLKQRQSTGKNFLKIFDGKIVKESKQPFESDLPIKERENKNGDKVYYVEYDMLGGKLSNADIRRVESLDTDILELHVDDFPDSYVLSIGVETRFGRSFLTRMLNLDLNKEMEIAPYSFKDKEGKQVSGLVIYQDGEKVMPVYTKEEPNGMPDAKKIRKGKDDKWDFTDQTNFLYDEFDKFKTKFPKSTAAAAPAATAVEISEEEEFDDLPF